MKTWYYLQIWYSCGIMIIALTLVLLLKLINYELDTISFFIGCVLIVIVEALTKTRHYYEKREEQKDKKGDKNER